MDLNGQSFDGFNNGGGSSSGGSFGGGSFGGGSPKREREREREFEDTDEELDDNNQAPEGEEETNLNDGSLDIKNDQQNFPGATLGGSNLSDFGNMMGGMKGDGLGASNDTSSKMGGLDTGSMGGLDTGSMGGLDMGSMFGGDKGSSLNGSSLDDIKGGAKGQQKNQNYDDRPLDFKEQLELEAAATALNAFAPPSGEAVKEIAKKKPSLWRRMVNKIKAKIKLTVLAFIGAALLTIIFNLCLMGVTVGAIVAVYNLITSPFIGEGTGTPALSADGFYGVRVYYTNDELARHELDISYNELAFDFLQSAQNLEGVESLNIELPPELLDDYSQYNTDLVLKLKYLALQGIINSERGENPEITIDATNYVEQLSSVKHFGFTYDNYNLVSTLVSDYFVEYVDASIINSQNFITFESGYTYNKDSFKASVQSVWNDDAFNYYKYTSDLVFVKDVMLNSSNTSTHVNGVITKYVYMAKTDTALTNRVFGVKIDDNSKYKIEYTSVQNGNATILQSAVADKTWYVDGDDIRLESSKNWLAPKGMVVNEMLDCSDYNINVTKFTGIDENNLNFLAQGGFSVYRAMWENGDSAKICFNVSENEQHTGFYNIDSAPQGDYVCLNITDVTENGQGTGLKINEISFE